MAKTTKEIINEMKLMLNENPSLTLESFMLPENFEDDMDETSFDEEGADMPQQPEANAPQAETDDPSHDISGIEKELTQIRKIALSVINRLADRPQSPQYDTMKKIWNMVDKAIEQPVKANSVTA